MDHEVGKGCWGHAVRWTWCTGNMLKRNCLISKMARGPGWVFFRSAGWNRTGNYICGTIQCPLSFEDQDTISVWMISLSQLLVLITSEDNFCLTNIMDKKNYCSDRGTERGAMRKLLEDP